MQQLVTLKDLTNRARQFVIDRDWQQFHNPANDARNLISEISELMDLILWLDDEKALNERLQERMNDVRDELSDVLFSILWYCIDTGLPLELIVAELTQTDQATLDAAAAAAIQQGLAGEYIAQGKPVNPKAAIDQLLVGATDLLVATLSNDYRDDKGELAPGCKELVFKLFFLALIIAEYCKFDLAAAFEEKMQKNEVKYPAQRVRGNFRKYSEYPVASEGTDIN